MIETSTLVSFILLNMSFALIPGPDVLCIITNSVTRGTRDGVMVCFGIATACLLHVTFATLGLTALLLAVPTAFVVVKSIGALYLAWLGFRMIRHPATLSSAGQPVRRLASPFMQGALSNALNPKIAIFFVAILPQFIVPAHGAPGMQTLILGLVSIASGTAVNLVTATLGGHARSFLRTQSRLFERFQQVSGALLIALSLRIVIDRAR